MEFQWCGDVTLGHGGCRHESMIASVSDGLFSSVSLRYELGCSAVLAVLCTEDARAWDCKCQPTDLFCGRRLLDEALLTSTKYLEVPRLVTPGAELHAAYSTTKLVLHSVSTNRRSTTHQRLEAQVLGLALCYTPQLHTWVLRLPTTRGPSPPTAVSTVPPDPSRYEQLPTPSSRYLAGVTAIPPDNDVNNEPPPHHTQGRLQWRGHPGPGRGGACCCVRRRSVSHSVSVLVPAISSLSTVPNTIPS